MTPVREANMPMWRSTLDGSVGMARPGMDLDLQLELFEVARDELDRDGDLLNQVLEVNLEDPDEEIEVRRYRLPTG